MINTVTPIKTKLAVADSKYLHALVQLQQSATASPEVLLNVHEACSTDRQVRN